MGSWPGPAAAIAILKVAIVEDQLKFRERLRATAEGTERFHCSGSFRSVEEALDKVGRNFPCLRNGENA